MVYKIFIFLFFIPFIAIFASQKELNNLNQEIKNLNIKFSNEIQKEHNEIEKLEKIEKSIDESNRIQKKIKHSKAKIILELEENKKKITKLKSQLKKNQIKRKNLNLKIEKIKIKLANRYRHLYQKRNQQIFIFEILKPYSFITKQKYFNLIKRLDNTNLQNYSNILSQTDSLNRLIKQDTLLFFDKIEILNLKLKQKQQLNIIEKKHLFEFNKQKIQKDKILSKIKKNKKLFKNLINQKKEAAKEITKLIEKLEKNKKNTVQIKNSDNINNQNNIFLKGLEKKLIWPVYGKIIEKFGKKRDRFTRLLTFNSGIDIQCNKNSKIKTVANGKIAKVFWLRGFGNTIITDHGKGYYSVYSKIKNILVNQDDFVESGKNIAMPSEENKMGKMHFEIWHKRKKIDPTIFLQSKK